MSLISSEELVLIGPGSEWFWTGLSGIVLAVTFLAIYRQLAAARTANALARHIALNEEWDGNRMTYCRLAAALRLKAGDSDVGLVHLSAPICNFFESLHDLEQAGHLTEKEIEYGWGRSLQLWWALLSSTISSESERQGARFYEGFERLNRRMAELSQKAGAPMAFGESELPGWIDYVITANGERWKLEQEIREGRLPAGASEPDGRPRSGRRSPRGEDVRAGAKAAPPG
jgi:hypothetical protein